MNNNFNELNENLLDLNSAMPKQEDKLGRAFSNLYSDQLFDEPMVAGREFTDGLNKEQKLAVEHLDGPLLILAGAGSGKTRVITHRIARLAEYHKVPLRNILAVTFTNKAAKEMQERVENLLGTNTRQLFIGTFHSLMARILRIHADAIGFNQHFTIVDRDGQLKVIDEILSENKFQTDLGLSKDIINYISSMKSKLIEPSEMEYNSNGNLKYQEMARVYQIYQQKLKSLNSMDFDDILVYTVKLFESRNDILKIYTHRFRYIMVDEYQDTNYVQYRIIELLSQEYHNICVVGDDDQSIYSFRGADMENILSFEHSFPNCKVIKLEQNYRSTQNILTAANSLISRNKRRKAKELWTQAGSGDLIEYRQCVDQYEEGDFIAREIETIIKNDANIKLSDIAILYRNNALTRHIEKSLTQRAIPFAIYGGLRFLDRREIKDLLAYLNLIIDPQNNIAFSRIINVPRRGIGAKSLEEIEAIASHYNKSYLEVAYYAKHFEALSRNAIKLENFAQLILNFRKRLFADCDNLADFVALVQEKSGLIEWYLDEKNSKSIEESNNRIENLREFISDTVEFVERGSSDILPTFSEDEIELIESKEEKEKLYKQMEVIKALNRQLELGDSSRVNSGDELNNTKEENDKKVAHTSRNFILLCSYLENTALAASGDKNEADLDKVSLSTVHSAKGLEYDYVFLIGFEEDIFPSSQSINLEHGIEEERRLAYVAITRAKQKLYICSTEQRLLYGRTSHCVTSRFLSEIPEEVIKYIGAKKRLFSNDRNIFQHNPFAESNKQNTNIFNRNKDYSKSVYNTHSMPQVNKNRESSLERELKMATASNQMIRRIKKEDIGRYLSNKDVNIGLQVKHAKYGIGVIEDIDRVANDTVVNVRFSNGSKRLVLKSAKLESVNND